jgi:uncharacterized membrane protein YdbT with pleckstrin-like domain
LLVGVLCSWITAVILSWSPSTENAVKIIIWLVLLTIWGIQSILSWKSWKSSTYEIGPESIRVNKKSGIFGSTQTIYRYESIIALRMTQGYFGKKYNFGDIRISIPKLDKEVVLRDIDAPSKQLEDIQNRINKRGAGTHNLVT